MRITRGFLVEELAPLKTSFPWLLKDANTAFYIHNKIYLSQWSCKASLNITAQNQFGFYSLLFVIRFWFEGLFDRCSLDITYFRITSSVSEKLLIYDDWLLGLILISFSQQEQVEYHFSAYNFWSSLVLEEIQGYTVMN